MVYTLEQFIADGKKNNYTPEQLDTINKERIKKWGVGVAGWDQMYNSFNAQKPKEKTTLQNFGIAALGLGGLKIAGEAVKKIGKEVYSQIGGVGITQQQALQIKQGRTSTQKLLGIKPEGASLNEVRTTPQTALERGGIFKQTGGNVARATTAVQTARRIWSKEVMPRLNKINDVYSIDEITKESYTVADNIKNKFTGVSYKNGVNEVIGALKKSLGKKFDLNKLSAVQLQDLRSHMMTMDIPQSAYRGVEVKESYKQGALAIIEAIKNKLNGAVEKIGGDVEKFNRGYQDYGNLIDMSESSAKKAGTIPSQNLQQMLSSTSGKPIASVSTVVGKSLFKIGGAMTKPFDILKSIGKGGLNILKSIGKGGLNILKAGLKGLASGENMLSVGQRAGMVSGIMQSKGVSREKAEKMLDDSTKQMLQLPGEGAKYLLDKALGLPQTKESKEYWKTLK